MTVHSYIYKLHLQVTCKLILVMKNLQTNKPEADSARGVANP